MATTCYEYMHENAEYKEIDSRTSALYKQIRGLEQEQKQAMHRSQALMAGMDVVRSHMWDLEGVSKSVDKTLEKYTTECSDCWFGTYGSCMDSMRDQVVTLATVIHNRKVDIDTINAQIEEIDKVKDALGDKLRAEFHAKEEAVSNV